MCVAKTRRQPSFLTNFKFSEYQMKHDFRVCDITSQTNPYLKRESGLKLSRFYAYPNYVAVLISCVFCSSIVNEFEICSRQYLKRFQK